MGTFKNDKIEAESSPTNMIREIRDRGRTTSWEDDFLESIESTLGRGGSMTDVQAQKLEEIMEQTLDREYRAHVASKDD